MTSADLTILPPEEQGQSVKRGFLFQSRARSEPVLFQSHARSERQRAE